MSEDIFNTLENDINNGSNDLDGAIDLEDLQNNNIEELQATASFLKIKELKLRCRARNLRLKEKDVIVAVDGDPFHGTILEFANILSEEDKKTLLTFLKSTKKTSKKTISLKKDTSPAKKGISITRLNQNLSETKSSAKEDFKGERGGR